MPYYKFYGFLTPLCNTRYSKFTVADTEYNSMEQYMYAQKAKVAEDQEAYQRIMKTDVPMRVRSVQIRKLNEDTWKQSVHKILKDGLKAKFYQNKNCRTYLLKTGDSKLAYCDISDLILGTGVARFSELANDESKWLGQNLLGESLMKLRKKIQKCPKFQGEVETIKKEI